MLNELIACFTRARILVVGDVMLDEYVFGTVSRISPEAPVPIVEADLERHEHVLGGAANVACNVRALGGAVTLIGVVGDDAAGKAVRNLAAQSGVNPAGLVTDPSRPTTLKTRIIAHTQQVVRVDREAKAPLSREVADRLLARITGSVSEGVDAIALSDYDKGVFLGNLPEAIVKRCRAQGIPCLCNAKPPNLPRFTGATVVSMNLREAEVVAGHGLPSDEAVIQTAVQLCGQYEFGAVVITRGGQGLVVADRTGQVRCVPAKAVQVYDVVGAGDTVLSALTLIVAAGGDCFSAAEIANAAGGAVVRKRGTATVTPEELRSLL